MVGEGFFISIDMTNAFSVALLGFIGGVLSGFIGSGGAFIMTPGMMNLGVPGVVAVGSNITHKFGKALMGWRKHGELGNVDKKLGLCLVITSFIGIHLAVWLSNMFFEIGGGGHGEGSGSAMGDLYISAIFIFVLSIVSILILRDAMRKPHEDEGPSTKLAEFFSRLHLPPFLSFTVADIRVSVWILAIVGLATGFLAGTIGVGGFIGVPAMIYLLGIPTTVAAGTELFLAMFMGAWGAVNYAWHGYVDLRLTLLLYSGSLIGVYIGAYSTKIVKERIIRLVTGTLIGFCVISRAIAVPMYLRQLGFIDLDPSWDTVFNTTSQVFLYCAGISSVVIIIVSVAKAYFQRMRIREALAALRS